MPTPSWTVSFTMPTASNSPAKACAGHEANRTRRLDQPPSPVTQIHRPARLATRAASFRYGGRHHSGIPGDIIPLYPGDFVGIRIQQTKRDRRHDKHIHRRDAVGMVMKERFPALRWWSSSFDHILGHARLSDVDAELEQLSVDPRRSPQRIGNAHLADKLAYLRRHSWSAATAPRLPAPERSEPDAVPFYDGLRLQNCQSV